MPRPSHSIATAPGPLAPARPPTRIKYELPAVTENVTSDCDEQASLLQAKADAAVGHSQPWYTATAVSKKLSHKSTFAEPSQVA